MGKSLPMTEAGFEYTGVAGDHATDGWLEWGLDAHYARKRAKGDFTPASNELSSYVSWAEGAEHWQYEHERREGAARAAEALGKAGMLAAAEAKIRHGVQIVGWESEWAEQRYRASLIYKLVNMLPLWLPKKHRLQALKSTATLANPEYHINSQHRKP